MNSIMLAFMGVVFFHNVYNSGETVTLGVFADCQYCDCETTGTRYYRNSVKKLETCISQFNNNKEIDFIVNLGDLIDRDFDSFSYIKPVLDKAERAVINVPGNHDLEVDPGLRSKVPDQLGLNKMYNSKILREWMFIFTDGNDISYNSDNPEKVKQAAKMTTKLKEDGKPNHYDWNGGIGEEQLDWFEEQLKFASKQKLKVVVFCHYPLLPYGAHSLWNQDEVVSLIEKYSCVKMWMNGHNHSGNYLYNKGIHYVTMQGMVETENKNAYAEVVFTGNMIKIMGYGREESRNLELKF